MNQRKKYEEMMDYLSPDLTKKGFKLYNTQEKNRIRLAKNGKDLGLIIANYQIPMKELSSMNQNNLNDFGRSSVIFYKDGNPFFRRMVENSAYRADKSLKKYSQEEINKIMTLTVQERNAMFNFNKARVDSFSSAHLKDKKIIYFQPKTPRLEEGIRKFNPKPVFLDYSHLNYEDPGYSFAKDRLSKTYFFLEEI